MSKQGRGPSLAEQLRAARRAGVQSLPLPSGVTVRVRKLTLMELIALDVFPGELQAKVDTFLQETIARSDGSAAEPALSDILSGMGGPMQGIKLQAQLAEAACVAGFVEPRVVATAAEVTDPESQIAVGDLDAVDRAAYWDWCQRGQATEVAALAPVFPPSAVAADPVPLEPDVRRSAAFVAGTATG